MASLPIELTFNNGESGNPADLLQNFFNTIVAGPMASYRNLKQYGAKQGQSYFTHVLDGITVINQLHKGGIVALDETEVRLLYAAFTIHDINKIMEWRKPTPPAQRKPGYYHLATPENIGTELQRLDFELFFPEWEEYIHDITLLAHYHQHDSASLGDLDRRTHQYKLDYWRLQDLGQNVMYAVDNLDLSHTLDETTHKDKFLNSINVLAEKRWVWLQHRLGENRGLLTNLIHNQTVTYLREIHPALVELLYYPEGVAYLIPQRELFSWTENDSEQLAQCVAQAVASKQGASIQKFIKPTQSGIKVDKAALEDGANFSEIMDIIIKIVERKHYIEKWYQDYIERLRGDIEAAAQTVAEAKALLSSPQPPVPLEQSLFKKGELATAYRKLLEDHLKDKLKAHKAEGWRHLYLLMELPAENFELYNQINGYRRGYFIAKDCKFSLDALFDRMLADVAELVGEEESVVADGNIFRDYLTNNLSFRAIGMARNFKGQLERYIKDEHKQCSNCNSSLRAEEWMAANVPINLGVQIFSNRLAGGSRREPKRNICGVCRAQYILEKLAWAAYEKKNDDKKYTRFYLHLYPYAFFTASQLLAMHQVLQNVVREDSRSFFLKANEYFRDWDSRLGEGIKRQYEGYATKVNGIPVPNFSDTVGNTPTLPLNAPGDNYGQQYIFALTHALMIAEFFGCRVVMSRTPVPLFSHEYLADKNNEIVFFADGTPRNMRWLLPTEEYRSLEAYRNEKQFAREAYSRRAEQWANETPDGDGRAAFENISRRLKLMYQLAYELKPNNNKETFESLIVDFTTTATDDPFALFYAANRAMEKKVREGGGDARQKGGGRSLSPEYQTILLGRRVAKLLAEIGKE